MEETEPDDEEEDLEEGEERLNKKTPFVNDNIARSTALKGQVTFLKLCLLVVCLTLIIPIFTLFD